MPGVPTELAATMAAGASRSLASAIRGFKRGRLVSQLSAYTAVSVVALAFDVSIFLSLEASGCNASLSAAAGYSAGLVLHFIMSIYFVFDAQRTGKGYGRLFTEFAFSGLAGLITTVAIVTLAIEVLHLDPGAAKLFAVVISFALTFALRRYLVFAWATEPQADKKPA